MIVVDASALVEVLLRNPAMPAVEARMFAPRQSLHAPHLLDLEVAHAIRRLVAIGDLNAQRGREALSDLAAFPFTRYPHDLLLPRIWELRHNLTVYDAAYVALAEVLDCPLLTCDHRLAAASGLRTRIEVV